MQIEKFNPENSRWQNQQFLVMQYLYQGPGLDIEEELLATFDTIDQAIEFCRQQIIEAAKICPDSCLPLDQFMVETFTEWHNQRTNVWYGDDLVLVDNDQVEFIPVYEYADQLSAGSIFLYFQSVW